MGLMFWLEKDNKKKKQVKYAYYVMISTKEKIKAGKGDKKGCGDYNLR